MKAFLLLLMAGCQVFGADGTNNPKQVLPKDLVEYVQEARRLGIPEPEIRENARKAGWSLPQIKEALNAISTREPASEPPASSTPPAGAAGAKPAPTTVAGATPVLPAARERREDPPGSDDYRIGAGDVLQISVWDEPKASVQNTVVRPDGRVGMPLLKEVEVLGLSPKQAEKRITERLSALIPNADVTVVVAGTHSQKIYAIGAVKREGPIAYTYRMSVLQALSEAGGLNDYAKHKKIYILRTEKGKEYRFPFDYDAVLKGLRMELNIILFPNDVIVVPR